MINDFTVLQLRLFPHCTIFCFHFSDAQIPDSIRPTFSNLADAAIFWEFYYRGLPGYSKTGSPGPETRRTTREVYVTSGTADSTTPWYIPSVSDREYNGKTSSSRVHLVVSGYIQKFQGPFSNSRAHSIVPSLFNSSRVQLLVIGFMYKFQGALSSSRVSLVVPGSIQYPCVGSLRIVPRVCLVVSEPIQQFHGTSVIEDP